jgi:succinylglutamate desuccinylase
MKPTIYTKQGAADGPTIAIFAGVHGNERAGILTLDYLRKYLHVERGVVHLVYANPPAIAAGVRYEHQNLNRIMLRDKERATYEDELASHLMNLLDGCDALLDLHAYPEERGPGELFAICEADAYPIANMLGVRFVVSELYKHQQGSTEQYMLRQNKVGICVELGNNNTPERFVGDGIAISKTFLAHFGCIQKQENKINVDQSKLRAVLFYKKQHPVFTFAKNFRTFDQLEAGELIGHDGDREVRAEKACYIMFPQKNNSLDNEAFMLAEAYE